MREVTKVENGLRITISNPREKQTIVVEELSRGIAVKCTLQTTYQIYTIHVNSQHLSDLISALQEIEDRRNGIEPAKRG